MFPNDTYRREKRYQQVEKRTNGETEEQIVPQETNILVNGDNQTSIES